jgi:hypothetical protein
MSLLARPAVTPPGDAMFYATPAELEHAMASWVLGFDLRVLCCGLVAGGWAVRGWKGPRPRHPAWYLLLLLQIYYYAHVKTYIV